MPRRHEWCSSKDQNDLVFLLEGFCRATCEVVQKIFLAADVAWPFKPGLWMQKRGQSVFWADWGARAFHPQHVSSKTAGILDFHHPDAACVPTTVPGARQSQQEVKERCQALQQPSARAFSFLGEGSVCVACGVGVTTTTPCTGGALCKVFAPASPHLSIMTTP